MGDYNKTIFTYRAPDRKLQIREFDNEIYGIDGAASINYQALASRFEKTSFSWDRLSEIKQCLDTAKCGTSGRMTMPRAKKDGQHLNCYIDRVLRERLEDYAEEKGQTLTMAVERLLTKALDAEEKKEDN